MIHTVSESSQVNEVSLDNNADDNKEDGDQIIDPAHECKWYHFGAGTGWESEEDEHQQCDHWPVSEQSESPFLVNTHNEQIRKSGIFWTETNWKQMNPI